MDILVACEESQEVCKAFREKGHNAFSCDIIPCSGGHPEWHIQCDVREILNPGFIVDLDGFPTCEGFSFETMDGEWHEIEGRWDMIIAFPPCTDLAVSGARHSSFPQNDGRQKRSIEFFCQFLTADCDKICIENPIGIISGDYIKKWYPDLCKEYDLPRKYSQIIQPWQFGHGETKSTCLWLKNLPCLVPENIVEGREQRVWRMGPSPDRAKKRSKTYSGIAKAMANQWG